MARQDWGLNKLHGAGTQVAARVRVLRLDGITGPGLGLTVSTAHNLQAGFTVAQAWIVTSDGQMLPNQETQVSADATNIDWQSDISMAGLTGVAYLEYIPA